MELKVAGGRSGCAPGKDQYSKVQSWLLSAYRRTLGMLVFSFRKEYLEDQKSGAEDNGAVGDVKRRPLILSNVKEQEVDNVPAYQAVPEVA